MGVDSTEPYKNLGVKKPHDNKSWGKGLIPYFGFFDEAKNLAIYVIRIVADFTPDIFGEYQTRPLMYSIISESTPADSIPIMPPLWVFNSHLLGFLKFP